jgi:hypothetical protein
VRPVDYNQRAFISGMTRSGKSVFARRLFDGMTGARRVLVDVKGEHQLDVEPVRDPDAIDPAAELIHYIPPLLDRAHFEQLYERIWYLGGPMVVWTDEAMAVSNKSWAPRFFDLIQQQGGGLGIGHIVCSQRPVDVALSARTQAEHLFAFVPAGSRLDVDPLAREIGTSSDALFARLTELQAHEGDHSFLWWQRGAGDPVDCAPVPL